MNGEVPGLVLHTRRARVSDADDACQVVRRSIAELCFEDHRGDAETLSEWLEDKTPARFEGWISSDRHVAVVAESDETLAGFGLLNVSGYIELLYVDPKERFRGVSKALLLALEHEARSAGISELRLESTETALRFYERGGYSLTGGRTRGFGCTSCHSMSKKISDTPA